MSGFDQSSIAVSMPTVVGADAALGGPYKIKPSEAFSGALMTVSGLTGETISVETSPDGYWGAPASPSFYRTDWQGTQQLYTTPRTNRFLRSNAVHQSPWAQVNGGTGTPVVATGNYATAPDGTTTACRIQANRGAGNTPADYSIYYQTPAARDGVSTYTDSIWLKSNTGADQLVFFGCAGTGAGFRVITVTPVWQRFTVSGALGVTAPFQFGSFGAYPTGASSIDILAWGGQEELGGAATSLIPTTSAAVTVTDYTLSSGVITLAEVPVTGAALSYDNSVLPSPYYIFATGDGVRTQFAYDGVWGTLSANSGKGNGIWQVDLRGAQAYRLVKSAGSETATVNMTLKRDALQYTNSAGTWSVT